MIYDILYDDNGVVIQIHKRLRSQPKLKATHGLHLKTCQSIPTNNIKVENNRIKPQDKLKSIVHIPVIRDNEITIIRAHKSLGDPVMILAGIQDLYNHGIEVQLKIHENSLPLFKHHPAIKYLDNLYTKNRYKTVVNLSAPCPASEYESNNKNIEFNRSDIFALAIGSKTPAKPQLYLTDKEKQWGFEWLEGQFGSINTVIGLVHKCAYDGMYRTYPNMIQLAQRLSNYQVVYIDKEFKLTKTFGKYKHIANTAGLNLRELMAVIYNLDLIVTPDTGQMHIAGALNIPILTLFGPTDGKVRTDIYDNVNIITGKCKFNKQPCWYNYCCNIHEPAPCMKNIKVDTIIDRINSILGE